MANRNIYTHSPDGNEVDNKILPEGTIAVRGNQIIVGDGVTEASELEPSGDPAFAGGGVSFVIASATVDISQSGSTELTYSSGVNGVNHIPLGIYVEKVSGTYTEDVGQSNPTLLYGDGSENIIAGNWNFNYFFEFIETRNIRLPIPVSGLFATADLANGITTDVYTFDTGATPQSSTACTVRISIIGIKTT